MFGFVKNWLKKSGAEAEPAPALETPAPTEEVVNSDTTQYSQSEQPAPASEVTADQLQLPLASIFTVLPADLQSRLRMPVGTEAFVTIPVAVVLSQLGRGSVKVTFGQLRQMTPEGIFYTQTDRDQAIVELPLHEILARINPIALPRRAQQRVEVSDEITSPFESKGAGLHIYKPEPAPPQAFVRKIEESTAVPVFPARGGIASVPPIFRGPATLPPGPIPADDAPIPMPVRRESLPSTHTLVQKAALPHNGNGNGASLAVALSDLCEAWPDAIRQEMHQLKLHNAIVSLPVSFTEDCLRKGRAISAWKQIRSWTGIAAATQAFSPHDSELLELPLKVIAPLFLARLRANQPPRKVTVDHTIPDIFSATAMPQPPAPVVAAPTPPPITFPVLEVRPPVPVMNLAEARGKARQSTNTDQFIRSGTDFLKRYATPNDIVAKAAGVHGVEGALITLPDGLLVASHLPSSLSVNGDALAAFVPQLFGRAAQSAREFRLGELSELKLTVGNVPWEIFKVGAIFFAVFGGAGGTLPSEQLKLVAGELDRKKQ